MENKKEEFLFWLVNNVHKIPEYMAADTHVNIDILKTDFQNFFSFNYNPVKSFTKKNKTLNFFDTIYPDKNDPSVSSMRSWSSFIKIHLKIFRRANKTYLVLFINHNDRNQNIYHHSNPEDFLQEIKERYKLSKLSTNFGL